MFHFSFYATIIIGLNQNDIAKFDAASEGLDPRLNAVPFENKYVTSEDATQLVLDGRPPRGPQLADLS